MTGGVGSGKSTVLAYLEEAYGARVLRLDDVSRALLQPGGACVAEVMRLFGDGIVRADGTLDRAEIAREIFADAKKRAALNNLIHPAVKRETIEALEEAERSGCRLFCIEAALLLEEKYDALCDEVWYIYADSATRYRRLARDRGYDEERIRQTMEAQLPEEEFRRRCDVVIDNSGTASAMQEACDRRLAPFLGRP